MTQPVAAVVLPALHGDQASAWAALMEVAPGLGDAWTLVGGQMVMLHQTERQPTAPVGGPRWSYDIDVVVDIRAGRSQAAAVDGVLRGHGFQQTPLSVAHRYHRESDGTTIDVLAPDHLGVHLPRLGRGHTLQAPGATQALRRTQRVTVTHDAQTAVIHRPSLIGAILMKVAASSGPGGPRGNLRHQQDVLTLAGLLSDDDTGSASLTARERRRLLRAAAQIADAGDLQATQAAGRLRRLVDAPSAARRRSKRPANHNQRQQTDPPPRDQKCLVPRNRGGFCQHPRPPPGRKCAAGHQH